MTTITGTPPFFAAEGLLDLTMYDTLESIEAGLEGVDVQDGLYEAYDSIGRVVDLHATKVKREWVFVDIGQTQAKVTHVNPRGADKLRRILLHHLQSRGIDVSPESDLADLVAKWVSIDRK